MSTMTRWSSGVILAGIATLAAAQDVVFRTAVDLVTVDAVVLGEDGRPLTGLRADDFLVEVDGRARPVVSSQFVASLRPGRDAAGGVTDDYTSNELGAVGRFIVIAVDEAHIRRLEGRPALQAAAGFLDTLDPADRVAVTGLSRVGTVEFTRDRAVLKRRLQALTGATDPVFLQFNIGLLEAVEVADGNRTRLAEVVLRECGRSLSEYTSLARAADDAAARDACPEQLEQEARAVAQHARTQARISLSALTALVDTLKGLDGPKTIVLLSEGMVVDPRLIDLGQLAAATRDARVTIYGLHMETPLFEASQERISPTLLQDVQVRGDGLARLAGAARGAMFRLVGSDLHAFNRIADEISGYYLLAVEPAEGDRDGQLHRINVRLANGRGMIRARAAFRMPPVAPSPRMRETDLVTLLRSTRPATELPVRVATSVYADPASRDLRVVVSTEAELASGPASDVLLGYVLVDSRGIVAASGAHRVTDGRRAFTTRIAPGNYTLRVAGIDPLGRRGVVQRTFRAVVAVKEGISVSDLILARGNAPAGMPLDPIVDRVDGSPVSAYFELYAASILKAVNALPSDIQVTFDILAADASSAVLSQKATVDRHGERWAEARAQLSFDTLAPGRYVVVGRVHDAERELARVTRAFSWERR
jgi:VWFA-related protein